jgi:hypothetical protein
LAVILFYVFVIVQNNDILRSEFEADDIAILISPFVPSMENGQVISAEMSKVGNMYLKNGFDLGIWWRFPTIGSVGGPGGKA